MRLSWSGELCDTGYILLMHIVSICEMGMKNRGSCSTWFENGIHQEISQLPQFSMVLRVFDNL